MKNKVFNLQLFNEDFGSSDFFKKAFEECYEEEESGINTTEDTPGAVESPESALTEEPEQISIEPTEPVIEPVNDEKNQQLTREELLEALQTVNKHEHEVQQPDERTQQALELMQYLEANPEIIQAMSQVDPRAHQTLNNIVPDEISKKLNMFEEFMVEQQFQSLVKDMKSKYEDFDEDKVLEYAEKHDVADIEVAYKAYKAETFKPVDEQSLREQIKKDLEVELRKQIEEEMKQTASDTQSIVSSGGAVPQQDEGKTLTYEEKKVARALGMTEEEYAKYL